MNGCILLGFRAFCAGPCGAGGSVPLNGLGPTCRYGDWNAGWVARRGLICLISVDSVGIQSMEEDATDSVSSVSSKS